MERKPLQRLEAGLPAAWYHDPAHYQQELEAFWYRRWVVVAREAELAATGEWSPVRSGRESMVLVREENQIGAFDTACRHRGSVLCTEEHGSFARKRIVCPYHSWTYDLAGQLVATPRRMEAPDFRLADFRLYPAALASWGGFIFINLAGRDAPPLDVGELEPQFERYRLGELRIGKRIVADVQANWKLLGENFSECFHCPPVHPELRRGVTAYREARACGLRGAESTPEFAQEAQTLTLA